ncbi:MAG: HPP family protein [Candidatus Scalinduaceae bacterium]
MIVKDVMSRDVITVTRDETLVKLIAKLRKHNFHTLPVIDEKKNVLGVVNSEDIMKVCLPLGLIGSVYITLRVVVKWEALMWEG